MKTLNKNIIRALLAIGLMFAGNVVMMGSTYTYYARVTINVSSPTGGGTVYISKPDSEFSQNPVDFDGSEERDESQAQVQVNVTVNANLQAKPDPGYHFDKWTIDGDEISTLKDYNYNTVIPVTSTSTKEAEPTKVTKTITGKFAENFYAELLLEKSSGTSGTPTGGGLGQSESAGGNVVFSIKAPGADAGYHFTGWTGNETFDISQPDSENTDVTVSASTTGGPDYKKTYKAKANYAQNIYYAKLSATSEGPAGSGSAKVEESPKSTTISGGEVTFEIKADPAKGYHFVNWTTTGDGKIKNSSSPSTTFTASASSDYGEAKAIAYTVTAHFAVDEYNAKLTSAVSSLSEGTGHSVCVSTDGNNWVESKSKSASAPNSDVTFYVKAEPAPGYKFIGWSESDGSSDTVTGLGAEGTFVVKSSSTQGGTNEKTLYAIFKKEYSITINANSSATDPKGKIVFKIVSKSDGGKKYRVSVPVGGSITLKDVGEGGYTITPETIWHWSYKVEPASDETDYDANNLSTNNFTVTPSGKNKKHDEASSTVTN